jgi:hypothetical protein
MIRTIDRKSNFALIGNNIDGRVNHRLTVFNDFSEVIDKLPKILSGIEGVGEWSLTLYQIPNDFKIRHLYGYYRVPYRGKSIIEVGYSWYTRNEEIVITKNKLKIGDIDVQLR